MSNAELFGCIILYVAMITFLFYCWAGVGFNLIAGKTWWKIW